MVNMLEEILRERIARGEIVLDSTVEPPGLGSLKPKQDLMTYGEPAVEASAPRRSFNEAFADARAAGFKEFEWGGKRYTTDLKTEAPKAAASMPRRAAKPNPPETPADPGIVGLATMLGQSGYDTQDPAPAVSPAASDTRTNLPDLRAASPEAQAEAARKAVPVPGLSAAKGFKEAQRELTIAQEAAALRARHKARAAELRSQDPVLAPETARAMASQEMVTGQPVNAPSLVSGETPLSQDPRSAGEKAADIGYGMMKGSAQIAQATGWLGKAITGAEMFKGLEDLGTDSVKYWAEKQSDFLTEKFASLDEMERKGYIEALLSDPGMLGQMIAESLPMMAAGMAPSAVMMRGGMALASRSVVKGLAARGATNEAFLAGAGKRAAVGYAESAFATNGVKALGAISEGLISAGLAGNEVEQFILSKPVEALRADPEYRTFEQQYGESAKAEYARALANTAAAKAGIAVTAVAGIGAPIEARLLQGGIKAGERKGAADVARDVATSAGLQGAEEALQNPAEALAKHEQMVKVDPTHRVDPIKEAITGMLVGMPMGAGSHVFDAANVAVDSAVKPFVTAVSNYIKAGETQANAVQRAMDGLNLDLTKQRKLTELAQRWTEATDDTVRESIAAEARRVLQPSVLPHQPNGSNLTAEQDAIISEALRQAEAVQAPDTGIDLAGSAPADVPEGGRPDINLSAAADAADAAGLVPADTGPQLSHPGADTVAPDQGQSAAPVEEVTNQNTQPEPVNTIEAQVSAMLDPTSGRDAVLITQGVNAPALEDLPAGVMRHQFQDGDVLLTTSKRKLLQAVTAEQAGKAQEVKGKLSLNVEGPYPTNATQAAVVRTPEGTEQAAVAVDPAKSEEAVAAAQDLAREGDTVGIESVQGVVSERQDAMEQDAQDEPAVRASTDRTQAPSTNPAEVLQGLRVTPEIAEAADAVLNPNRPMPDTSALTDEANAALAKGLPEGKKPVSVTVRNVRELPSAVQREQNGRYFLDQLQAARIQLTMKALYGTDVHFYTSEDPGAHDAFKIDGDGKNRVFVRANGTTIAPEYLPGHEFFHAVEENQTDGVTSVYGAVVSGARDTGVVVDPATGKPRIIRGRGAGIISFSNLYGYDPDITHSELSADVSGLLHAPLFARTSTWDTVFAGVKQVHGAKKAKKLINNFAIAVKNKKDEVTRRINGQMPGYRADQFLTESGLNSAFEAIGNAVRNFTPGAAGELAGAKVKRDLGVQASEPRRAESALNSPNAVSDRTQNNRAFDRTRLPALRRAAAGIESPERGITFRVTEDGQAVVTGPARTKVPTRFQRFADKHGLPLVVRRAAGVYANANEAMPVPYRESGALYFGEVNNGPGEGAPWMDRTGKTRFSKTRAVEVSLSAATSAIKGLKKLQDRANAGDKRAQALLTQVARDGLERLVSEIPSAKVRYTGNTGLYFGELEPSLGLSLQFDESDSKQVLAALAKFADNFNQHQFHVRQETDQPLGHQFDDGSWVTLESHIKVDKPLSRDDVQKVIDASGLIGLSYNDGELFAYYIGAPNDTAGIDKFADGVGRAITSLGSRATENRSTRSRIWVYGRGDVNGEPVIPYSAINGDVRTGSSEVKNRTAVALAEDLAGRDVWPVKQAGVITAEQRALQDGIRYAYEQMPLNGLDNKIVRRAYEELANEVRDQFESLPVKVEVLKGQGEPYPNSAAMRRDVLDNNHIFIFGTEADTFGPPGVTYDNHPLLADSGYTDVNGTPLLYNDLLRAVHDYYAHTMSPTQFGAKGEEAAWKNHMAMTRSPWARWALTSETRGQNSWVNFRQGVDDLHPLDKGFAVQKVGLLPISMAFTGDREVDQPMRDLQKTLTVADQYGSVPPVTQVPTYGEQKPRSTSALGEHYSGVPRRYLGGQYYGTGLKGEERARVGNDPVLKYRAHFYVDSGNGVTPEKGVGAHRHTVKLNGLYDQNKDPLGLWAQSNGDENTFERAVHAAGFTGTIADFGNQRAAVLIGPEHHSVPVFSGGGVQPSLARPRAQIGQAVPFAERDSATVSTRTPSAKAGRADPHSSSGLHVDIGSLDRSENMMTVVANRIKTYPGFNTRVRKPDAVVEAFIDYTTDNLLWLYDQVPPEIRERSKLWYVGGRAITDRFVAQYGGRYSDRQMAAVIAVHSPKTPWDPNVSQAERVTDIWTYEQDTAWSAAMDAEADAIVERNAQLAERLNAVRGKTLRDVAGGSKLAAVWVRVFDGAHHDRGYRLLSPEGDYLDFAKTGSGSRAVLAFGAGLDPIRKGIDILKDGSMPNISRQLGEAHKVRNFYNNIVDPMEPNSITIDTHAVAAALLRPLGASATEVADALGGIGANAADGISGTYAVFAEAYRRAAAARGVLPREMQSITWEALRGLFSPAFKSGYSKNPVKFDKIIQAETAGLITTGEAREEILNIAKGIDHPRWYRPNVGRHESQGSTSYSRELHRTGGDGRVTRRAAAPRAGDGAAQRDQTAGVPAAGRVKASSQRFFSPLARAVGESKAAQQPAQQWKLWLHANKAKLGLKDDEIQWSGILDYLDLRGKDKVTKAEIADYLSGNGVKVEDVVKGGLPISAAMQRALSEFPGGRPTDAYGWAKMATRFDNIAAKRQAAGDQAAADKFFSLAEEATRLSEGVDAETGSTSGSAKFSGYWAGSYKGGIDGTYREILVTLPEKIDALPSGWKVIDQGPAAGNTRYAAINPDGVTMAYAITEAQAVERANRFGQSYQGKATTSFKSSHWDEPNVLVHVRLDEVNGADGKRYVRVGEVQSDWGQKGKKEGFNTPVKGYQVVVDGNPLTIYETRDEADAHAARAAKYGGSAEVKEVTARRNVQQAAGLAPTAPFVTDTKAWVALGIKRAILHAIDVGADGIVFGTGEQNANLYDLRKTLSSVTYHSREKVVEGIDLNGDLAIEKNSIEPQDLESVVGKEIAENLLRQIEEGNSRPTVEGDGLKVGGEGMKAFYDKIVPSVANEVLKKLGGGKVGTVNFEHKIEGGFTGVPGITPMANFDARVETNTQPGFTIPEVMRAKVEGEGMPLFSKQRITVGGIERPTTNSNGKPIHQTEDVPETNFGNIREKQTNSAAFKDWFGDWQDPKAFTAKAKGPVSHAFDWNTNKPLVLYHATNGDFSVFETGRKTINSTTFGNVETSRHGIFTSPDVAFAEGYLRKGDGQNVMPVYMRLMNPIDMRAGIGGQEIRDIVDNANGNIVERDFYHLEADQHWELFDGEFGSNFVKAAKAAGYDGAIMIESSPEDGESREVYVAFDPTQIKSAIGNTGAFDGSNPDIRFSLGRKTPEQLRQSFADMIAQGDHRSASYVDAEMAKLEDWFDAAKRGVVPHAETEAAGIALATRLGWSAEDVAALVSHGNLDVGGGRVVPAGDLLAAAGATANLAVAQLLDNPSSPTFAKDLADTLNLMIATRANLSELGRALAYAGWMQRRAGVSAEERQRLAEDAVRRAKEFADKAVGYSGNMNEQERQLVKQYNDALKGFGDALAGQEEADDAMKGLAGDVVAMHDRLKQARKARDEAKGKLTEALRDLRETERKVEATEQTTPTDKELARAVGNAQQLKDELARLRERRQQRKDEIAKADDRAARAAAAAKDIRGSAPTPADIQAARQKAAEAERDAAKAYAEKQEAYAALRKARQKLKDAVDRAARAGEQTRAAKAALAAVPKPVFVGKGGVSMDEIVAYLGGQKGLDKIQNALKIYGKNTDVEHLHRFMQGIATNIHRIKKDRASRKGVKAGVHDSLAMLLEQFRASILTGIFTHGINLASNAVFAVMEQMFTKPIAEALPGGQGALRHYTELTKAIMHSSADIIPLMRFGITEEFPAAHFTAFLKLNKEMQDTAMNLGSNKWMDSHGGALPGSYGKWVRSVGFAPLGAMDLAFKLAPYRLSVRMQELSGKPVDYNAAVAEAEYMTFQNQLDGWSADASRMINRAPVLGFIVPFLKTLINLIGRSFDYTPGLSQVRNVYHGNYTASVEARNRAIGQAIVGTALAALAVWLHGSGDDKDDSKLSGLGPAKADRRAAWLANNEPLGLHVGNWIVPLWRIEPLASVMGLSIAASDAVQGYSAGGSAEDVLSPLGSTFLNIYVGKSFMKGASDLLEGITAAEKGSSWRYFSETLPQSIVLGAAIPNALAQAGDITDQWKREANGWREQAMRKIPVLREQLERKLDAAGNPIPEARYGTVLPVQRVPDKVDVVAKMLLRFDQPLTAQPKPLKDAVQEVKDTLIEMGIPPEKATRSAERLRSGVLKDRYAALRKVRDDAKAGRYADEEALIKDIKKGKSLSMTRTRKELREELNRMRAKRGLPPKEFEPIK